MLLDFDEVFIKHAIEQGFVTADQVDECRQAQKAQSKKGRPSYLGQLLIQKRYHIG